METKVTEGDAFAEARANMQALGTRTGRWSSDTCPYCGVKEPEFHKKDCVGVARGFFGETLSSLLEQRGNPEDFNYRSLRDVLDRAYEQASSGKGAVRHGQDKPFDEQPMQKLIDLYGVGFALGQAGKKSQESMRLDNDAAIRELLGAINYIAGAIIHMEKKLK